MRIIIDDEDVFKELRKKTPKWVKNLLFWLGLAMMIGSLVGVVLIVYDVI